jgi:spermidine/putrescine transport system permease protein
MMQHLARYTWLALILSFLYLPIAVLIGNSFNASKYGMYWKGWTLKWYNALLHNSSLIDAALHSITIGFLSASIATLIGTITAVALFRHQFKGKPLLHGLLFVVISSPDIILAVSLLILFLSLGIELGFVSLLLAHITFCLPFVVISISARLNDFDPKIIEAARDLGATESQMFRKILVPIAMPAILSSWIISFTLSLDDVIISSFVTGPSYEILPIKIYSMVKVGVSPEVNALATLVMLISLIFVSSAYLIAQKLKKDHRS